MSIEDTDFVEVMRGGVAYKATKGQLDAALSDLMLTKSVRFRGDTRFTNKPYMVRVPAAEGNRKTWTFSAWLKRGQLATNQTLFDAFGPSSELYHLLRFNTANQLTHTIQNVGTLTTSGKITQYDRWKHVVFAYDSTQAVAADRVKIYINNVKQTLSGTYPELNHEGNINSTQAHNIGRYINGSGQCYDGLMTAVTFVDGQALPASSFGRISKDGQNRWNPKKYSAVGPNGFYLTFEDNSSTTALGKDSSSNGNNFSTSGFYLTLYKENYDSFYDVPTPTNERSGNFNIMNPSMGDSIITNTYLTATEGQNWYSKIAMPTTGKWYIEVTILQEWFYAKTSSTYNGYIGIVPTSLAGTGTYTKMHPATSNINARGVYKNGTRIQHVDGRGLDSVAAIAYDAGANTIQFYRNGAAYGSKVTGVNSSASYVTGYPQGQGDLNNCVIQHINFGQQPFKYPIPAGFQPCNSFTHSSLRI